MLLGIDFGLKNTGVAVSDTEEKLAVALTTLHRKNLVSDLLKIIKEKNVTKIILGYPAKGSGEEGFVAKMMRSFMEDLQKEIPTLEFVLVDESMSSQIAIQTLRNQGFSSKSIDEKKDSEAARIILQTYLDNN